MKRGLPMDKIITDIYELMKDSTNPIDLEENIQKHMWTVLSDIMQEIFSKMNQAIKEEKQRQGWKVKRNDPRTIQYVFGPVQYKRTLMEDPKGQNHYPLDEWLGVEKRQRYSPLVEVKVAELVSDATYRDTANFIEAWTPIEMSHQTVKTVLERVGNIQGEYDQALVDDMKEAAHLPEGKKVDFLYAEADGVLVRSTKKNKNIEIHHAITYEGWEKNGKRVSVKEPQTILTTKSIPKFWDEVQTLTAHSYSLENTRMITNSDGGNGYTAEKFQTAFSQSNYPVLNQLDTYHIKQGLNRTFGMQDDVYKPEVREAIEQKDLDKFTSWMDTFESTLEKKNNIKKVDGFRTYITGNWKRIFDWRDQVEDAPADARRLGVMESNQRRITFRMKKRGMHWSKKGAEAMVKIKQGIFNGTLREAYIGHVERTKRQQREDKRVIRHSKLFNKKTRPSIGAQQGSIAVHAPSSSAIGQLAKIFR